MSAPDRAPTRCSLFPRERAGVREKGSFVSPSLTKSPTPSPSLRFTDNSSLAAGPPEFALGSRIRPTKVRPTPLNSQNISTRLVSSAAWQNARPHPALRVHRRATANNSPTNPTSSAITARILSHTIVNGNSLIAPSSSRQSFSPTSSTPPGLLPASSTSDAPYPKGSPQKGDQPDDPPFPATPHLPPQPHDKQNSAHPTDASPAPAPPFFATSSPRLYKQAPVPRTTQRERPQRSPRPEATEFA